MSLLSRIYSISFIFAANLALTAYVNSTFLSAYVPDQYLGFVYVVESLATLIILELLPRTEEALGNRRMSLVLLFLNICSLSVLVVAPNAISVVIAFVVYFTTNNLIVYAMDIFIRHFSRERSVGTSRGLYLFVTNLAWIGAPFVTGFIVTKYGYGMVYLLVLLLVLAVFIIANFFLRAFKDASYKHLSFFKTLVLARQDKNLTRIIALNFLLQFFFSWMVIYTPIYLHEYLGFGWEKIGLIFTIMLLPFVLFELPLGRIADKYLGEKKLLILGFCILIGATFSMSFITSTSLIVWALVLFGTRTGAATIEIMSETYFFKKIDDREPSMLSLFRSMIPLSFLLGPLIASALLFFVPIHSLFAILAGIAALSFFIIAPLKDVK